MILIKFNRFFIILMKLLLSKYIMNIDLNFIWKYLIIISETPSQSFLGQYRGPQVTVWFA